MCKMIGMVWLLGMMVHDPLLAQDRALWGAWELTEGHAFGRYEHRLHFERDGTFRWTSLFTGSLDALLGLEEVEAGGEVYTFRFGSGTLASTFQGTYGVAGDQLTLTGVNAEVRINKASLRAFYMEMGEQLVTQYAEKVGRMLGDAKRETRKGRFVEGALTAVEADLAEPLQSTYTFRLAGEMLVLRDENGYVAVWQQVPEHTGVSAASWGQVKAQGR